MYLKQYVFEAEEIVDIPSFQEKKEEYEDDLVRAGNIGKMFERSAELEEPTYESEESFYEKFVIPNQDINATIRLGTTEGGSMDNIYISIKEHPETLDEAEALAQAVVSVCYDNGGTYAEVTHYHSKNEFTVKLIA